MITEEEARRHLGKYCCIMSNAGAGITGIVCEPEDGWLTVDYGYAIRLEDIATIEETVEKEE